MTIHKLTLPIGIQDIEKLTAGDKVMLSGTIYTARDAAHRRLINLITEGSPLPIDLPSSAIFYCGPSPTPSGKICGAIGPTTSSRMDPYTIQLLQYGLRVMIGKGERSPMVAEGIKKYGAVYLSCLGGISALLSQSIVSCETFLWPELGAEAIFKLNVCNLPTYVSIV
jgi:fumarate hydratase subunit beta